MTTPRSSLATSFRGRGEGVRERGAQSDNAVGGEIGQARSCRQKSPPVQRVVSRRPPLAFRKLAGSVRVRSDSRLVRGQRCLVVRRQCRFRVRSDSRLVRGQRCLVVRGDSRLVRGDSGVVRTRQAMRARSCRSAVCACSRRSAVRRHEKIPRHERHGCFSARLWFEVLREEVFEEVLSCCKLLRSIIFRMLELALRSRFPHFSGSVPPESPRRPVPSPASARVSFFARTCRSLRHRTMEPFSIAMLCFMGFLALSTVGAAVGPSLHHKLRAGFREVEVTPATFHRESVVVPPSGGGGAGGAAEMRVIPVPPLGSDADEVRGGGDAVAPPAAPAAQPSFHDVSPAPGYFLRALYLASKTRAARAGAAQAGECIKVVMAVPVNRTPSALRQRVARSVAASAILRWTAFMRRDPRSLPRWVRDEQIVTSGLSADGGDTAKLVSTIDALASAGAFAPELGSEEGMEEVARLKRSAVRVNVATGRNEIVDDAMRGTGIFVTVNWDQITGNLENVVFSVRQGWGFGKRSRMRKGTALGEFFRADLPGGRIYRVFDIDTIAEAVELAGAMPSSPP